MPSYKRPGVYVSEFLTPNQTVQNGSTSVACFIGGHHRGPTAATLVNSWGEFVAVYGGFPAVGTVPSELPYSVYQFFSNGGRQAVILRVIGTGALTASATLADRSAASTLTVAALNAGAWGNNLRIDVVNRGLTTTGKFDVIVKSGGTTDAYIVERFTDLSMVSTDPRYAPAIINSLVSGSAYIAVTDAVSASVAPNNTPDVVTGSALTGGADGSVPSSAQKQAVLGVDGSSGLDAIPGILMINIPGESSAAVLSTLDTYAQFRGDAFVVVDVPVANTPAQAVTFGATLPVSSYTAAYYPWVQAQDPMSADPAATHLTPPGGFVCGIIAQTDAFRGVWKAPAGLGARLTGALALERKLSNTELDTLNASNVNAIRQVPGAGVVVMGARTQSYATADKFVNVRRTLNYIKSTITASTQFGIFENNDQLLWNQLSSITERFLTQLWTSGGLKGGSAAEAFYVKCDAELNTEQVIAAGEVRLEIGVALQRPAEYVVIRIGQWEGGSATSEA